MIVAFPSPSGNSVSVSQRLQPLHLFLSKTKDKVNLDMHLAISQVEAQTKYFPHLVAHFFGFAMSLTPISMILGSLLNVVNATGNYYK